MKLRLATRGNLSEQRWLTLPHFHDKLEREALRATLKPGSIFLDIGANAGFYTFWALAQGLENLRVIAIEPTRTMLERMRHNLSVNELTSAVTLFPCAVTAKSCQVVIEEHSKNLGQSSLRSEGTGNLIEGRPLADILHEAGATRVDAMKIDIEGHEVPVLEAFFQTAPRSLWPRLIIGEIVGKSGEPLQQLLITLGYHLTKCTKMNGILYLNEVEIPIQLQS